MGGLTFARRYMLFWAAIAAVFFAYINWYVGWSPDKGGTSVTVLLSGDRLDHWWNITHRVWISVAQTLVLAPLLLTVNLPAIRRYGGMRSQMGKAILFLSLGFVAWGVVGNGIWFGYQISHGGDSPAYPWWTDVAYVLLLPAYLLGMLALARAMAVTARDFLRQSWIFGVALLATAYVTVPLPGGVGRKWVVDDWSAWHDKGTFGPFNWVHASVGYVATDIVILSMAVIVLINARRVAGGMFHLPTRWVAVSVLFQYLGDLLFDQRYSAGIYRTGDIATICYGISMYLIMYAVLGFAQIEQRLSHELLAITEDGPVSDGVQRSTGATAGGSSS